MKITDTASIPGRGHAIFTDEPWSLAKSQSAAKNRRLRITAEGRTVEIDIKSVEAALKDHVQYLAFMVPTISEKKVKDFIQNREVELV
jgi:hypothetical protein